MDTRPRALLLVVAASAMALVVGGCVYSSSEKTTERAVLAPPVVVTSPAPAPPVVVTSPAPAPPVVVTSPAPAAPVVVTSPTERIVSYPEGRYQLSGDSTTGYYWVWIPAGSTIPAPPAPPAVPRVSQSRWAASSPVVVARPERTITYPEGRYELYGDPSAGYYWAWIPTGIMPPAPPPAPPRFTQSP